MNREQVKLLEKAAKVMGLEDAEWDSLNQEINYERTDRKHFRRAGWNPIIFGSDCFEIICKKQFDLKQNSVYVAVTDCKGTAYIEFIENHPSREAALRWALVKALVAMDEEDGK